jgi:hypothetical protein
MSSEMDPKSETLDTPVGVEAGVREWPGVSQVEAEVRFPGEDGGRSLSQVAERDLSAALQVLAERAQNMTGATGAAIALGTSSVMVCSASAGDSAPPVGAELQVESGLSGESVRTRKTLCCDDAQTDERVNRESCEALGIASVVVLPMVEGNEVVGVFELFSDRPYAFGVTDIKALERLAAMVLEARRKSPSGEAVLDETKRVPATAGETAATETGPGDAATPVERDAEHVTETRAADGDAPGKISETAATGATIAGAVPESGAAASLPIEAATREQQPEQQEDSTPKQASLSAEPAKEETSVASEDPQADDVLEVKTSDSRAPSLPPSPEATAEKASGEDEPVLEAVDEPDPGEMVRDAAERTAAWKASLLEDVEEAAPETEHFAFHMHGRRSKTAAAPSAHEPARDVEVEEPVTAGALKVAASAGIEAHAIAPDPAGDLPAEAKLVAEAKSSNPAVQETSVVSTSGSATAAAAAPALEKPAIAETAVEALPPPNPAAVATKTEGVAISAKPASAPVPVAKPAKPVARPASAEGRSKLAVSQLKRCESCGFPVSGGRQYCLDCEKHQAAKDEALKRAKEKPVESAPQEATAAADKTTAEASAKQAPASAAVTPKAEPATQPTVAEGEEEAKKIIGPAVAIPTETAAKATAVTEKPETVAEKNKPAATEPSKSEPPPTPQFMVTPPNQYESWIVSNMYTAVAIAIVVIGIVVYLVSR